MQDFLKSDDITNTLILEKCKSEKLTVRNLTSFWNESNIAVSNISFELQPKERLVVAGPVGSSKSGLLLTLLGELKTNKNHDFMSQLKFSYACQESWIFNTTIKENVIFHSKYDQTKYKKVIKACALIEDLEIFSNGDQTFVGEKGQMLSGGQKARINLARCIYQEADVYLLDDPLSAVDNKVRNYLFKECICEYLKDKMVILVTHHPDYIKSSHNLLILEKGRKVFQGSYEQLEREKKYGNLLDISEKEEITVNEVLKDDSLGEKDDNDKLNKGKVSWNIYLLYMKHGKVWGLILSMIFALTELSCVIYSNYLLSTFYRPIIFNNSTNTSNTFNEQQIQEIKRDSSIILYGILIVIIFMTDMICKLFKCIFCFTASKNLHNHLFKNVIESKISFFDKTPVGNILNRFSRDLQLVDYVITDSIRRILIIASSILAGVFTCILGVPWLIIAVAILTAIMILTFRYSIPTLREIRRMEAAQKSQFYSHISETIKGLVTIRSFRLLKIFEDKTIKLVNEHSLRWFMLIATSRWFCYKLNYIISVFTLITTMSSVAFADKINPDLIALGLVQLFSVAELFELIFRQIVELENAVSFHKFVNYSIFISYRH